MVRPVQLSKVLSSIRESDSGIVTDVSPEHPLKANFPIDFFAATMSLDINHTEKLAKFAGEVRRMKVPLLPPDVNYSQVLFDSEKGTALRYALSALKGVGVGVMEKVIEERQHNGQYKDIFDWAEYGYEWLVTNAIIEFMNDIISGFKDPSFFEEQEYRFEYIIDGNMIKKYDDEIHFRATETLIIPYIKLISSFKQFQIDKQNGRFDDIAEDPIHSFMKLPIKEIIIGPSLDFEMTKMGIEELLKKCDYTGIKIIKSKIPYRL